MSNHEEMMNFEETQGVAMGDMPSAEVMEAYPEANSALERINAAIEDIDQKGEEVYGSENWDLMNSK